MSHLFLTGFESLKGVEADSGSLKGVLYYSLHLSKLKQGGAASAIIFWVACSLELLVLVTLFTKVKTSHTESSTQIFPQAA